MERISTIAKHVTRGSVIGEFFFGPLCVESDVACDYISCEVPCVGTFSLFIPATKGITEGSRFRWFGSFFIIIYFLSIRSRSMTVRIESNGVLAKSFAELCSINLVFVCCINFRRPATEGISILLCRNLSWRFTIVGRSCTIWHIIVRFDSCFTIHPCYGIGIRCTSEVRSYSSITCHSR